MVMRIEAVDYADTAISNNTTYTQKLVREKRVSGKKSKEENVLSFTRPRALQTSHGQSLGNVDSK